MSEMSEKALMTARKREYRTTQRERYRRSVFIVEYTQRKNKRIYEEANRFYQKLVKRYPTKTKLTTCPEFKTWEATIEKDHDPATQIASISISSSTTTPATQIAPISISSSTTTTPATQIAPISISSSTTTPIDLSSRRNIQLNIPLMDSNQVQEMQDTLMFQDIYPSLLKEINPETLEQIISEIQESDVNIQLMDSSEIQEMRDTPDIHPPMLKEINPETLDQIISEIEESDVNIFYYDEDINDILNIEINNSMNELSPLEKELLMH